MLETPLARPGPLKDEQEQEVMEGSRRIGRQDQGSILTLELLRRAPDGTLLLDDLGDSGVPLLLDRRQFTTILS
jgi:hypothetical protein